MYGSAASAPAVYAAKVFKAAGAKRVLELAAGHGRDALYFARQGFTVLATDFSDVAAERIRQAAQTHGVAAQISTIVHDMREPLPLEDQAVDASPGVRGGVTALMYDDDIDDTYVPIEECADRLGLSVPEVEDLVAKGLLRARRNGGWLLEVQPALIPGVTTSTAPKPEPVEREPRTGRKTRAR
jgi:hypothetical protein